MSDSDSSETPRTRGIVFLCVLAAVSGIGVGLVGGGFRWCLDQARLLREGLLGWSHTLDGAGWIVPVVTVAACAALAALITQWAPLASGSGIPHVEAVSRGDLPAAPMRLLPAKFVGGVLAIGSGLVLGREGPTVHMGAMLGAGAARLGRRDDADVRSLQTSLGGAGLAVAFNAPIGGALFVFEEVTRRFRLRELLPTAIGVAVAVGTARLIIGDQPDFTVTDVAPPAFALLPVFIVFGLLTGLLGIAYNRLIVAGLDLTARYPRVPAPMKAALIGAVIGLALFFDPLAAGGGDAMAQLIVGGPLLAAPALLVYLAVRFVAGPLSYAAGTPGGLFAPILAVGALWGALFAVAVEAVLPGTQLVVPAAIVGMAAFFAATVRAPFTGIVLVIEMTAITTVTVPMLAAVGAAVLVTTLLRAAPIYDSLRERMELSPGR